MPQRDWQNEFFIVCQYTRFRVDIIAIYMASYALDLFTVCEFFDLVYTYVGWDSCLFRRVNLRIECICSICELTTCCIIPWHKIM